MAVILDWKSLACLFVFGLLVFALVTFAYGIHDSFFDTRTYIKATEIFQGKAVFEPSDYDLCVQCRFLRPVQLVLVSFEPVPLNQWFYFLNAVFFLAAGLLLYGIVLLLLESKKIAFFSGMLFYSSAVAMNYSLTLLTEAGTYFFYALCVLLILVFYKKYSGSKKIAFGIALLCGFSVLMKESAGVGIILLLLLVLFSSKINGIRVSKNNFLNKLVFCALLFFVFLIPSIINQAIVFLYLNFTYLDYFAFQVSEKAASKPMFTLPRLLLAFFVSFTILIPGFFYALREKIKSSEWKLPAALIFTGLFPTIMYFIAYDRLVFMLFPIAIPFGILGTQLFFQRHFARHEKFLFLAFVFSFVALNIAGLVLYRNQMVSEAVAAMF